MNYQVIFSLEAVEDVLRITLSGQSKTSIVDASSRMQDVLRKYPYEAGMHLHEGLYYVDFEPLRAFFTIDDEVKEVEIVNVHQL